MTGFAVSAGVAAVGALLVEMNRQPNLASWLAGLCIAGASSVIVTWRVYDIEADAWHERHYDRQRYELAKQPEPPPHPLERITPHQTRRMQVVNERELWEIARALLTADGLLHERRLVRRQIASVLTNYSERYGPLVQEFYQLGWLDQQNEWTGRGIDRLRHYVGVGHPARTD